MANTKLGAKHTCASCGAKFYDLNRSQPLCPRCGWDPRESAAQRADDDRIPFDDDGGVLQLRRVFEGGAGDSSLEHDVVGNDDDDLDDEDEYADSVEVPSGDLTLEDDVDDD